MFCSPGFYYLVLVDFTMVGLVQVGFNIIGVGFERTLIGYRPLGMSSYFTGRPPIKHLVHCG